MLLTAACFFFLPKLKWEIKDEIIENSVMCVLLIQKFPKLRASFVCAFIMALPKVIEDSNDRFAQTIPPDHDAVYSAGQNRSIWFSLSSSHQFIHSERWISKDMKERKAAVDVCIIITVSVLCFLSVYIVGVCRQFVKSIQVPALICHQYYLLRQFTEQSNSLFHS